MTLPLLRRAATAALATALAAGALGGAAASAAPTTSTVSVSPTAARAVPGAIGKPGVTASDGAYVLSETVVDAQTVDLAISSPALGGTGMVRLWLPAHWATAPKSTTWPTLYLLHGAVEPKDYLSWTVFTQAKAFMAPKDVLTVMPTAGQASLYSDPWNNGRGGGKKYETFHMVELPQLIEGAYRGKTSNRAVAGLSIGGLGAFKYAAKYPGFFSAAASYSGMLNNLTPAAVTFVASIGLRSGQDTGQVWGSSVFQRSIWSANNPTDLAPGGLAGIPLFVSSGNGLAGPYDCFLFCSDPIIEPAALSSSSSFVGRARALGLNVTTDFYGAGTHSWPYWNRELQRSWPTLAKGLGVAA